MLLVIDREIQFCQANWLDSTQNVALTYIQYSCAKSKYLCYSCFASCRDWNSLYRKDQIQFHCKAKQFLLSSVEICP